MARAAGRFWKLAFVTGVLGYEVLMHVLLARHGGPARPPWLVLLAGVPHAVGYLFLLWLFGRTLRRGSEALITGLARRVHGHLPPHLEAYTRRLTRAWCVFFAAQLAASASLLAFASLDSWSLFVNLLNLPLVVAMFVADYHYRVIRYPHGPHASIAQAIAAFARHRPFP